MRVLDIQLLDNYTNERNDNRYEIALFIKIFEQCIEQYIVNHLPLLKPIYEVEGIPWINFLPIYHKIQLMFFCAANKLAEQYKTDNMIPGYTVEELLYFEKPNLPLWQHGYGSERICIRLISKYILLYEAKCQHGSCNHAMCEFINSDHVFIKTDSINDYRDDDDDCCLDITGIFKKPSYPIPNDEEVPENFYAI
jgi:hypothetical protein